MLRSAAFAAALLILCTVSAAAETVPVTAIRFDHDAAGLHVVLELTAPVPFTWDGSDDGRHLVVTLVGIDWRPPRSQPLPKVAPLLAYRFEPAIGGAGRVDIEAARPLSIRKVREIPAGTDEPRHRIVIDLAPLTEATQALDQGVRAVLGLDGAVDLIRARDAFTRAAAAGSAEAAFNLGELYRAGRGVEQDYRRAAEWFRRAAAAGFAPARFHLAVLLFNGAGVPRDPAQARVLIEQAAAQGLPQARQALAELTVRP